VDEIQNELTPLPDVYFDIGLTIQNKRLENFMLVKFLIAAFLMSGLSPTMDQKLSRTLNSLPMECDLKRVGIVTSSQVKKSLLVELLF
jgi:hypothetical protein